MGEPDLLSVFVPSITPWTTASGEMAARFRATGRGTMEWKQRTGRQPIDSQTGLPGIDILTHFKKM